MPSNDLLFVPQRVTVSWKHDPNGCITKSHGEITPRLVGVSSELLHVSHHLIGLSTC